jgi:hypothetical protein
MRHGEVPVMAGPGDKTPGDRTPAKKTTGSGGDGPPAASPAGREQVIAALKTAFVQGRLSRDEFELRVGQALAIYAELDALTADIPAAASAVAPRPGPSREAANKKMIQQGTAGAAALAFVIDAALLIPRHPIPGVIIGVVLMCFVSVLAAGFLTLLSWALDRHAAAQPGQASPPGCTGGPVPRAADQQGRFPETGQDPPHTALASRRRSRRLNRLQTRPAALTS